MLTLGWLRPSGTQAFGYVDFPSCPLGQETQGGGTLVSQRTLSTRPSCSQEAECKKEMLDVKFMADTKIADSKRAFELQKSAFSEEVNVKVRSHKAPRLGLRAQDLATSF